MTAENKPAPFYWQLIVNDYDSGEERVYCYLSYEAAEKACYAMQSRGAVALVKRSDKNYEREYKPGMNPADDAEFGMKP